MACWISLYLNKNRMDFKHFSLEEFDSPDFEGSGQNMDNEFLYMLDDARDIAGIPFKINSGYRTEDHNKKVGGKKDSSHLIGLAADISCKDSRQRSIMLSSFRAVGFTRIGIGKTFIHVDSDMSKDNHVTWLY